MRKADEGETDEVADVQDDGLILHKPVGGTKKKKEIFLIFMEFI